MLPSYFMEHPGEGARLRAKVDVEAWTRTYFLRDLRQSKRVLEIGCGPGHFSTHFADLAPGAEIVGLDASADRIADANAQIDGRPNLRFIQGAADKPPFADESVDLVLCRFLLEYTSDRQRVLAEIYRILKPGGVAILQDLDGQLIWNWPIDPHLARDIETVVAALRSTGFDELVGRKLYSLSYDAGFRNLDVTIEPYHQIVGAIDERTFSWWSMKLRSARRAIEHAIGGSVDDFIERVQAHLNDPRTLTYSNLFTVRAAK
jgi:ubiquinone/menaquinone biosynthesis C-methylase UbiE